MKHDEFVGQVQNRAALSSRGEAEKLIRLVLQNLGARIQFGEAKNLASQLPEELGRHLMASTELEKFDLDDLFERVAGKENVDLDKAIHRTRVVAEVLMEAVSEGSIRDLLSQLPKDFSRIFTGASGPMPDQPVSWEEVSAVIVSLHQRAEEKAAKSKAKQMHQPQVPGQAQTSAAATASQRGQSATGGGRGTRKRQGR